MSQQPIPAVPVQNLDITGDADRDQLVDDGTTPDPRPDSEEADRRASYDPSGDASDNEVNIIDATGNR